MTIHEAIKQIDALKFNTYTQSEKIKWLSIIDGIIKQEIIDTHEGGEDVVFDGYDENMTEEDMKATKLLVHAPNDDLYVKWLESQIDYTNAEYDKYNNSKVAFNTMYSTFSNWYTRNHMPLGKQFKCF